MMCIHLICHGKLKHNKRFNHQQIKWLPVATVHFTSHTGHAQALTKQAIINGATIIIGVGGDGTINEIINGAMAIDEPARNKVTFTFLPQGTGNDFCRTMAINNSFEQLIKRIQTFNIQSVDVGQIHFINPQNITSSRYFINVCDLGIGGEMVERINRHPKKWLPSSLIFFKSIVLSFITYQKKWVEINAQKTNDEAFFWKGKIISLVLANGKFFGSGMNIAPNASLHSGFIQSVIIGDITLWQYFMNISNLRKGHQIRHSKVIYQPLKSGKITSNQEKCAIDIDGEFVGYAPASFNILPSSLNLLIN